MRQILKNIRREGIYAVLSLMIVLLSTLFTAPNIYAEENTKQGFLMTPMKQQVIINPGDSYRGSFTIFNQATNSKDFPYTISIRSFYVDENYNTIFDQDNNYSQISEWVSINSPLSGSLSPNEKTNIDYTISVPKNAPAGGQYVAIVVTSDNDVTANNSAVIEKTAIAHTIFAEITGSTTHSGEIVNISVPTIFLSGNIFGESTIKNTGNVHGDATYTMQIYPLFSNEEIFTNTESPDTHIILPDRSFYNKTEWPNTPSFGIFKVKYIASFEGLNKEIDKIVVVCPIWLMLIIAVVIMAIVIGIVTLIQRKKRG